MAGRKSSKSKGKSRKGRSKSPSAKRKKRSNSKLGGLSALASNDVVEVDILSPAAMKNAQYICHHAPDCLEKRGFAWPHAKKGKKGKKGKKKKKKK